MKNKTDAQKALELLIHIEHSLSLQGYASDAHVNNCDIAVQAIRKALTNPEKLNTIPTDMVLVPREPTEAMYWAGKEAIMESKELGLKSHAAFCYVAMIQASEVIKAWNTRTDTIKPTSEERQEAMSVLQNYIMDNGDDLTKKGVALSKLNCVVRKALSAPDGLVDVERLERIIHCKEHGLPNGNEDCNKFAYITIHKNEDGFGYARSGMLPSEDIVKVVLQNNNSKQDTETLIDDIEKIVSDTHDIDTMDKHYAENIGE